MFSYPNIHCVRILAVFSKHGIHFKYTANKTPMSVKQRTGELLEACLHCSLTWVLSKHCPKAALHVHEPWKPVCSLHLLSVHYTCCCAELQPFPTNPPFMLRAEKFFCRWLNLQPCSNSNARQWPLLVPTASRKPRSAVQMNLVSKKWIQLCCKIPTTKHWLQSLHFLFHVFQVLIFFRSVNVLRFYSNISLLKCVCCS